MSSSRHNNHSNARLNPFAQHFSPNLTLLEMPATPQQTSAIPVPNPLLQGGLPSFHTQDTAGTVAPIDLLHRPSRPVNGQTPAPDSRPTFLAEAQAQTVASSLYYLSRMSIHQQGRRTGRQAARTQSEQITGGNTLRIHDIESRDYAYPYSSSSSQFISSSNSRRAHSASTSVMESSRQNTYGHFPHSLAREDFASPAPTTNPFALPRLPVDAEEEYNTVWTGLDPNVIREQQHPEPLTEEQLAVDTTCKICCSQKVEVLVEPCMHISTCRWCIVKWHQTLSNTFDNTGFSCPTCRGPVKCVKKVFFG